MEIKKVHSDKRGETHSLTGELLHFPEVAIFYTKRGVARGGCIHPKSKEYLVVLEGEIEYVYGDDMQKIVLYECDSFTIGPNVPHYFISTTDSVVAEWGPPLEEKQEHHEYFRSIVNALNSSL